MFPAAIEDPVLLDTERTKINQALRLSKDRVEEAVWSALTRLAARHGRGCAQLLVAAIFVSIARPTPPG